MELVYEWSEFVMKWNEFKGIYRFYLVKLALRWSKN